MKKVTLAALLVTMAVGLGLVSGCSSTQANTVAKPQNGEQVVLLHGLGRSSTAMWMLAARLQWAGYQVHNIDYDSFQKSPSQILDEVSQQISGCCQTTRAPVHFVGHSLGGLMIRAYLDQQRPENLGHVVLIGTPNQGTDFVDKNRNSWWMQLAGDVALALGTGADSFPNSLPSPDYPLGVIAGYRKGSTGDDDIAGADDGLVPLISTPVTGMNDFLLVESGHSAMRYNGTVAAQTIHYLDNGKFDHPQ